MAAFRQLSTFHICARSSRADRAMPESQPGFGLPEIPPTRLRSRTGLVERGSGAALVFTRMRPGIETAMPFPRILIMGIAAADRDRAGVHIPIVDVPAFLAGVSRSAAGELGHSPDHRSESTEREDHRELRARSRPGGGLLRALQSPIQPRYT